MHVLKDKKYIIKNKDGKQCEFLITKIGRKYIHGEILYPHLPSVNVTFFKDILVSKNGFWRILKEY